MAVNRSKLKLVRAPTGATHEEFATFLRRQRTLEAAADRKKLVDEMKALSANFGQNSHARRDGAQFLLDNPDLIADPAMVPFVYRVLEDYVEKVPARPLNAKEVAEFVDSLVHHYKMLLREARQFAADETQKTYEAVKQAHLTYGKGVKRNK